MRLLIEPAEG